MPDRCRVEHEAAAQGRPVAEDDPVSARGDDRSGEPQLRIGARPDDARGHGEGAVVDVDARAVADRLELVELDVEAVARPQAAGRDQHVAAPQLAPLDARQGERDPLPRLGPLDRPVVHLDAADAHVAAGGLGAEHVALADGPGPERPGRDGADPLQREDAVDVEPGGRRRRDSCCQQLCRLRGRPRRGARRGRRPSSRSPRRPPPRAPARAPPRARARASPRRPRRPS